MKAAHEPTRRDVQPRATSFVALLPVRRRAMEMPPATCDRVAGGPTRSLVAHHCCLSMCHDGSSELHRRLDLLWRSRCAIAARNQPTADSRGRLQQRGVLSVFTHAGSTRLLLARGSLCRPPEKRARGPVVRAIGALSARTPTIRATHAHPVWHARGRCPVQCPVHRGSGRKSKGSLPSLRTARFAFSG